ARRLPRGGRRGSRARVAHAARHHGARGDREAGQGRARAHRRVPRRDEDHVPARRDVTGGCMAVARVTRIIGASPHSWDDAVRNALERANKPLRGITGIEVLKENAAVEDGKIAEYRAMVQVTFVLEGT